MELNHICIGVNDMAEKYIDLFFQFFLSKIFVRPEKKSLVGQ